MDGGHEHARGAEPALQSVAVAEGLLERVQGAFAVGQPFDGLEVSTLGLNGEHQAGPGRTLIDQDRAGAAHTVFAAEVGAGQPEMLPERVGQGDPRLDVDLAVFAVDREGHSGWLVDHWLLDTGLPKSRTSAPW